MDARAEVKEALVQHYGVHLFQEVLDLLGTEEMYRFPTDGLVKIHFPGFEEETERIDGPWMGGGQNYIRIDETTFQDAWGVIRRIGSDGKFVETFGQFGIDVASFNLPIGVGTDSSGNIFVADSVNNRVMKFAPLDTDLPEVDALDVNVSEPDVPEPVEEE